MKRLLIGLTAVAACALLLPRPADAGQKRLGRSALQVLKVEQSARMAGMGGAFVAVADDINTIFINPAGLTHIDGAEYLLVHTRWLVESRFYSGALAYNTGRGVIGLSVMTHSPPEMEERTIFEPLGTGRMLDAGDISIGVTFARKMTDKLSFGAMVRWTQETLDQDRLSAVDVNLGTMFYTGFRSLRLGMAFSNLGKDLKALEISYHLPVAFNFAFAFEPYGQKGAKNSYLTITGENYYATDFAEPQYKLGGELWLQDMLALRGGYKLNYDAEDFSLGVGVKFQPAEGKELRVDFAYTSFGDTFKAPLRFSLSGSF